MSMKLRDLFLGNIDAKNELVASNDREIDRFLSGFLLPPTVVLNEILSGEKYFITGIKGTGKTSLLRYIDILLKRDKKTKTQFFLFKSRFTEEDRCAFAHNANRAQLVTTDIETQHDLSYEVLWKWFIYKSLITLVESSDNKPFLSDRNWKNFSECILSPQQEDESSGIRRLLPKIIGGKVSISSSPSLEIDFDWENKEKRTVNFGRLIKQADILFSKLKKTIGNDVAMIFDELEIGIASTEKRSRDIELIRDLVLSIEQFNSISREHGYEVRIIAAIRTEVLSAIESVGKEINKTISDFGVPIIWNRGGVTSLEHPLIDIVVKRIVYSERTNGILAETDRISVWNRYFPKQLYNQYSQDYILSMTWLRPRDVVRLLNIAKTLFPDSQSFNEHTMAASSKEYSYQSWVELIEELSTRYEKEDLEAIRILFTGYTRYFDVQNFCERFANMSSQYKQILNIANRLTIPQLITDLYNVGALGNVYETWNGSKQKKTYRYHYKGDYYPIMDTMFVVHKALCPFFGIR